MASARLYFRFLLFQLPYYLHLAIAQNNGTVPVGATLIAGSTSFRWLSPSGDFAFGFRQLDEENSSNDLFLLSIFYNKIPEKTVVWYTDNKDQNSAVPRGSQVKLTADQGLVLNDPQGKQVWSSKIDIGTVAVGHMNDTGNFMLASSSSSSHTYDGANSSNSGYRVMFSESGYMYILKRNSQRFDLTTGRVVPAADFYHRATLNFDGVFAQYYYPRHGNGNWSVVWSQPDNICVNLDGELGSGACGFNSICSLNGDKRPMCDCPKGYSLLDKTDKYGSCKADFDLSCNGGGQGYNKELFDVYELKETDWPMSDYDFFSPYDEEQADTSVTGKAFIKYRKGDDPSPPLVPRPPDPEDKKKRKMMNATGSVLLGSSVFVNFALVCAFVLGFFFIYKKKWIRNSPGDGTIETNLRCFSYKELEEATDNFKEEVGRGSFGIVYKGVIQTTRTSTTAVAVKKLDIVFQDGEREFKNEVFVIGQTHHKNLVRLLGFCDEGQNRLLVYEFLNNGTLASFLFGNLKPNWNLRTNIAFQIARGLLYLHEDCSSQIIHCDMKPQNILLDDHYNARISDFGLAKLLTLNQSKTIKTSIRGTKGYVAPEWFRNSKITAKVDVYSFGVLLLEIIACRKSFDIEMVEEYAILTDWAFDCYRNGKLDALVGGDMEAMNDVECLEKLVMVSIWCIQEDPSLRPTIKKVLQMLEGVVEVSVPPNPYPFSSSVAIDFWLESTPEHRLRALPLFWISPDDK
ncbi:G-type lectin S-receptor-like serine/threonine-protein kinase RLK1 [Citrus sinensis]|uniref:G-type lectin S-receptor-like serine/threonine-protein kinase RLK1 n=1 Tax=Citrus sinensis TaxID=2711 RepID=A0ACB8MV27_CITSI|nr:G-type lectin S-receptor-like serine/threonine-protein kinase RLK1 [Citrus sinensis]KAH9789461.1 G-type lectin S-receptor-like serine/threonine-protein kinase RLK1 [Citrus sinensis]